jgi:transcriptional regulator with XRE-family HTH domain
MANPLTHALPSETGSLPASDIRVEDAMTGEPLALASRLAQLIGDESLTSFAKRSGINESLLRKYLKGAQPNARNLARMAEAGGTTVAWLVTGQSSRSQDEALPEAHAGTTGHEEALLLNRYRQADAEQKQVVHLLLETIANPGVMAWIRFGAAITRIANIFPPPEASGEVESDEQKEGLAKRLAQTMGDESMASFARRSGLGAGLLRKYLHGAMPSAENLVKLAEAGGVTVDWLASGRLPRIPAEGATAESDELNLLAGYRRADPEAQAALQALLGAIARPSTKAWYQLGEAITHIFPSRR